MAYLRKLVGVFALSCAAVWAQGFSSLNGTVTDSSGAVVVGAAVEITNEETGLKRSALTDHSGLYSFAQLAPGKYKISVQAVGFATQLVGGMELPVNTPVTVPIALEVGGASQTVSVTSEAAQVNTTDASLGNAITTQAIIELPFEGRNPASLLALQAGVTYFGRGSDYGRQTGSISTADRLNGSVNGSKPDQNNITLDGVDVNDQNTRNAFQSVLRVTLDSVQEFRTTTQNPTAEQGRGSGAQIALVTKAGTNELHGSLYEYHRNTITSANDFFNNLSGVPRAKLIRNTFGTSLGGPAKKNRLFYFANWEGRRDASEQNATRTVPTAMFRQGIVQYLNKSGGVSTLTPAQLKSIDPAGLGVNPAVISVLNSYPVPNDSTVGDGLNTAGFRFKASTPVRLNTYIAKIDYVMDSSNKNTVFWRGNLQNDNLGGTPQFPGQAPASVTLDNSKGYAAGWTSLLSPSIVSTFRYGYTRAGHEVTGIENSPYVSFRGLSTLNATTNGLTRIIPVHQFSEDFSWTKGRHDVRFGGVARIIRNKATNFSGVYPDGSITYSYLAGTGASLKPADLSSSFSTSYRAAAVNLLGPVDFAEVTYNYSLDGKTLAFGTPVKRSYGAEEYEFYANDTWRLAKNLTITAGLRYSLAPAIYETNGYQVSPTLDLANWFEQRGNLANAGKSQADAGPVSFILASSEGGKPLYETPKLNFSPRFAIAYSPTADSGLSKFFFGGPGKTSIRAGFGMFYDLFGMSLMRNFDSNAPGLSTQFQTPASANLATNPRFTGYNSLPLQILPSAPAFGFPFSSPSDVDHGFAISNSVDQHIKQPYTMNLNFSVGREFNHGLFIQGSYVGRLSRRSLVVTDLAQPTNLRDPQSGVTYWQAVNELARASRAGVATSQIKANPFWEHFFPGLAGGGLTATQAVYENELKTYPTDITSALLDLDELCDTCSTLGPNSMFNSQYASLFAYRSLGKGNYHSMQWVIRKKFSSGLQFDFNYTWSKSIDLTSSAESDFGAGSYAVLLNPYNTKLNKGVSDFDVTHSVSGFAVYQLPFGKGKMIAGNVNKIVDAFIGGWQVTGIYSVTSGLPRSVANSGSWPTNWNYSGFATQIAPVAGGGAFANSVAPNGTSGPNIFANPTAARSGYDYSYAGDIGQRNGIRGDGFMTVDMSLGKTFTMPYNEHHTLQFRWEVFNVPNTVRFDINTASLDVGNTGTFGKYTSTLTQPRVMQFGLRYQF
jgi:hypothetical protein